MVKYDWKAIKTEYITTNQTFPMLSKKYGVGLSTLQTKAAKEKWTAAREEYNNKTVAKTTEKIGEKQAERASELQEATQILLQKAKKYIQMLDEMETPPETYRKMAGTLKDIQEIQSVGADKSEQKEIVVKISKDLEDYAK